MHYFEGINLAPIWRSIWNQRCTLLLIAAFFVISCSNDSTTPVSSDNPVVGSWRKWNTGTSNHLSGIWGTSPDNIFAVGVSGTIINFNGEGWKPMVSGITRDLEDIWGTTRDNIFAVGDSGTILHYDGKSWRQMISGTTNDLEAVWANADSEMFAVGGRGSVMHYDGQRWESLSVTEEFWLFGVWGEGCDVFMVGADDILEFDCKAWNAWIASSGVFLWDVWGCSVSQVFVVGRAEGNGLVASYNGNDWAIAHIEPRGYLHGVWGSSCNDIFAVGYQGLIMHYNGVKWRTMDSGEKSNTLWDVWGSSPSDVWAVGAFGTALHYTIN